MSNSKRLRSDTYSIDDDLERAHRGASKRLRRGGTGAYDFARIRFEDDELQDERLVAAQSLYFSNEQKNNFKDRYISSIPVSTHRNVNRAKAKRVLLEPLKETADAPALVKRRMPNVYLTDESLLNIATSARERAPSAMQEILAIDNGNVARTTSQYSGKRIRATGSRMNMIKVNRRNFEKNRDVYNQFKSLAQSAVNVLKSQRQTKMKKRKAAPNAGPETGKKKKKRKTSAEDKV